LIQTIEIICKPCRKCELLLERIETIIRCIETRESIRIKYKLKLNGNILHAATKYGYAINKLPLVIINGSVEFVGHVKQEHLIRMKLEEINKEY